MSISAHSFVILLAEDEPADAHLVRAALIENRILATLQHVVDGRQVLEYLRQEGAQFANAPRPDLILLDLNMPRMNGRECLAAIKQDPALRDIPVVILTTSTVERDVLVSYDLGAAGYVTKPVDISQFIDAVRNLGDYWIKLVRLPRQL
ncbi:response regulator [Candidatus Symbiobacter mobilis]|uniref:CheY-like chemotaxis protein n=1 Tax=Candidatus Symbiobacter mobilis CR TaxID=946483 RepID=U5NBI9_9BURK|nr:response regulator [Candidatus Symbiobacter mobilis]AGX88685.1 CheY-like chemotaxis protein [Candidatus Symbiobacter mobilis CR]